MEEGHFQAGISMKHSMEINTNLLMCLDNNKCSQKELSPEIFLNIPVTNNQMFLLAQISSIDK